MDERIERLLEKFKTIYRVCRGMRRSSRTLNHRIESREAVTTNSTYQGFTKTCRVALDKLRIIKAGIPIESHWAVMLDLSCAITSDVRVGELIERGAVASVDADRVLQRFKAIKKGKLDRAFRRASMKVVIEKNFEILLRKDLSTWQGCPDVTDAVVEALEKELKSKK